MKHKVVACIPTKDHAWLQTYTLKHLSEFCDKIIVSDDHSTDDTYDVCSSFEKVEYYKRPPRDFRDRQGSLQRQELLERAYKHDPDYFFFLDADEMPSPDIIDWINSLGSRKEEKINLWTFPWVHLWKDDKHYRVDSYSNSAGNIHWNPFTTTYRKGFFARNIPGYEYKYDITKHRCRPSNQPGNVPKGQNGELWVDVKDSPVIIHYGKISGYFKSETNFKDRLEWDYYERGDDKEAKLNHYRASISEETLQLEKVKEKWFWK